MEAVLHSLAYTVAYLEEMTADVPEGRWCERPMGMGVHPAWIVGHVAYTLEMLGGVIGLTAWLPAGWAARYGPGSVPGTDPGVYGAREELMGALRDAASRVDRAVRGLSEAALDAEFPDPAYRGVFPTVRHALTQVLVGHAAYHVGQVSVWRRAMGLPAMGRAYE